MINEYYLSGFTSSYPLLVDINILQDIVSNTIQRDTMENKCKLTL